jgi:small subunit ribosomal protein S6
MKPPGFNGIPSRRNFLLELAVAGKEKRGIMEDRLYDLIFIVRPATPEEDVKKVQQSVEHACTDKGAKIEKTEHWGTRKLAYRVAKHREGIYVYYQIRTSHNDLIVELERRLKVQDTVIKYLTIRLDEDLKRQKKLTAIRDKRAARRPKRPTPAPASTPAPTPVAAAPAAPAAQPAAS